LGDLILVADSHLVADDPHTAAFLRFLRVEGRTAGTLILVGDIFDLWIAQEGMELPFHRVVVEAIDELRQAGVTVKYVEGNRDYFVGERYARSLFAEVAGECLEEHHAGHRIHVAHGDLVNVDDKQYRLWRRTSRSRPFLTAFRMLPVSLRARLAAYLERKMRRTNLRYRIGFPTEQAEIYARQVFEQGVDTIVLGHFHEARRMVFDSGNGGAEQQLFVLPGWREDRRYLRFDDSGGARFVEFSD